MSAHLVRRRSVGNLTPDFGFWARGSWGRHGESTKDKHEEKSTEFFLLDGKSIN